MGGGGLLQVDVHTGHSFYSEKGGIFNVWQFPSDSKSKFRTGSSKDIFST